MAILAESPVEEWLNRDVFFTIRGVKLGVGEMDLLRHVEVQVSFRPIGYIAHKRTDEMMAKFGGGRTSAKLRTPEEVAACAREWVKKKFLDSEKARLRERLWPGVPWSFHLVHGVARYPHELEVFTAEHVTCHPFHELLTALSNRTKDSFSGSAGGDIAEIVSYYKSHELGPNSAENQ